MLELTVAATCCDKLPSVLLKQPENFTDFHKMSLAAVGWSETKFVFLAWTPTLTLPLQGGEGQTITSPISNSTPASCQPGTPA
jgi:hypothetical protein